MSFSAASWPIWVAVVLMLLGAVANFKTMRVPNVLTLPMVLAGWIASFGISAKVLPGVGSPGGSLLATVVGMLSLYAFYAMGGLGAGNVKMQMAFGAWVGAGLPLAPAALVAGVGGLGGIAAAAVVGKIARRAQSNWQLVDAQTPIALVSIAALIAQLQGWLI